MKRVLLILSVLALALPAFASETGSSNRRVKDPGGFYNFVHSFAPETAVDMWRGGNRPDLAGLLKERDFQLGQPVFLRIFKDEGIIEVWMQREANQRYELFDIYPLCKFSGALGPKQKTGDKQAPEGFYEVNRKHLNPNSKYHLAINMGYPNAYDKEHGRTGDFLMIHGACASIGCYAMTDKNIEEVYTLVKAAFDNGQDTVSIHAFPFRMTDEALRQRQEYPWINFWLGELLPAYQVFDITGIPPKMMTCAKTYQLMEGFSEDQIPETCEPIAAWK